MTDLMTDRVTDRTASEITDSFVLDSELAAMAGLEEWVDELAVRHGMTDKTRFAARLCIEESVSNSIRHGYRGVPGNQVRVAVSGSADLGWVFMVEDDAPHFNPLAQAELPAISPDFIGVGGQGIRLMRAFATWLSYDETPTGNRLQFRLAQPQSQPETLPQTQHACSLGRPGDEGTGWRLSG